MKKGFWISKRALNIIFILIILDGIVISQLFYDGWKLVLAKAPNVSVNVLIEPHPLPADVLKKSSLGLNNLIADVIWLQTIQYYGGGLPYERYRELAKLIETTTELDPKFAYPYSFGLLILPGEGFTKEAIKLGEKGLKNPNLKNNWEIPYYMAITYRFNLKDKKQAAKYFEMASKRPGAPEMAGLMAGINYEKANQRLVAYKIYEGLYKKASNSYVRQRAKDYMDHLVIMESLERAGQIYKEKYGNFPVAVQDLVTKKIIQGIPEDPLKRGFVINPQTGLVSDGQKD